MKSSPALAPVQRFVEVRVGKTQPDFRSARRLPRDGQFAQPYSDNTRYVRHLDCTNDAPRQQSRSRRPCQRIETPGQATTDEDLFATDKGVCIRLRDDRLLT